VLGRSIARRYGEKIMRTRTSLAAVVLAVIGLATPALTTIDAASATTTVTARHPCTHTSSGSCIRGGEFCPQASYGHSGWDAKGRRYVCKGDRTHPHWMIP
jgi:hypothetical protein